VILELNPRKWGIFAKTKPAAAITPATLPAPIAPITIPAKAEEKTMAIGTIVLDIEKGVEVGAADVLKFLTGVQSELKLAPAVAAALGSVLGSVSAAVASTETAVASGGVNIVLDQAALTSIKSVWPQVQAAFASVGIKI
jgi:hypothetical protein